MAKKKTTSFQDNLAQYSELVQIRAVYRDTVQRIQAEFLATDTQKTVKQLQAKDGEFSIAVTQEALEAVVGELDKRIEALSAEIEELE
jgi:uncharacterized small protein (DUF1192 family)